MLPLSLLWSTFSQIINYILPNLNSCDSFFFFFLVEKSLWFISTKLLGATFGKNIEAKIVYVSGQRDSITNPDRPLRGRCIVAVRYRRHVININKSTGDYYKGKSSGLILFSVWGFAN